MAMLYMAATCFMAGAAVTVSDVVVRALFSGHVHAAIETTTLLIAVGALLSMPVCYTRRRHVSAKLISEFLPGFVGRALEIIGSLLSLVFAMLLFAMMAWQADGKFGSPETMPDTGLRVSVLLIIASTTLGFAVLAALCGLWGALRGED